MKTTRIPTLILLTVVCAIPHFASAAVKLFGSLIPSPATTNISAGVATNIVTTVTLSGNGSGSTGYKGPATFTLSLSPSEPTITLSITNNPVNLAAATSVTNAFLSFTTTGSTPSNTYVVTIVANTNPPNASLVTPITNFFTVTMVAAAPFNPLKVWSPGGINGNWTTVGNWSPSGAPGSSNDVKFFDAGAVGTIGVVDNTVDTTFTLGSLMYGQTNNFHTTQIASGATLTISGTNGLAAGTGTDNGDAFVMVNTITGSGGSLVVNNSSANINVSQSHTTTGTTVAQSQAQLDVSGVDTLTATASRLLVGVDLSIKGASGILNLARTNKITMATGSTAPQIDVGDNSQAQGSPAIPSILLLGQTNAIFADSIATGRGKTDGNGSSILFNSSFASPVAYFRGTNGTASRVGTWAIGDGFGSRNNFPNDCHGSNDFSLGTINALVGTMFVGKGASTANGSGANVTGTGTLIFNAGTVDVDTLEIGYALTALGFGTVNANGGSLVVNTNLELAHGIGSAGTLNIANSTVSANAGVVAGGGTATLTMSSAMLNATNSVATVGTVTSPLTTLAVTNSTLKLAVQNGTPSAAATMLSCDGANTISISSLPVLIGLPSQFTVLQYTVPDGNLGSFTLGSLPSASPSYAGYISNNVANSSIDLVITAGPIVPALTWSGQVNSNWDTTTLNWKTNGSPSTYQQGYPAVRFDDSLTGTNFAFLTTTLTPGNLTVDNSSEDYTFGGTGKISGSTGLTKTGTRNLTLTESGGDDFTGNININNGVLQVGNGGTIGALPPVKVSVDALGTLAFNRSDNLSVSSIISGLGTLSQNGASILALNGSNSAFSGSVIVASGTLQPGSTFALGAAAASITVSNGATLDVNGQQFNNNQPITAIGSGVNAGGAIVNNNTNQTKVLRNVTLGGNTTFGGSADWDIHSSANNASDATLSGSSGTYKLTKASTNSVTIFGAQVDGNLGDIDILAGSLSIERNTTSMGDSTKTATVFTNATLQFNNASNVWNKVVLLKDGGTLRGVNRAEFAGPVTLESGVGTLLAGSGSLLILDGVVSGAGGLTKNGAGAVTLANVNSYTGPTLVSLGSLALTGSGSIDSSTNITLSAGTALDLSSLATPTLTVTSGRGLKGSGTVIGSVTMASGSTLTVGGPGSNTLGTLTVTNSLVLQAGSTNLMEISKVGGTTNNDQVVATNITYGGTLTVTGIGGVYATNDTFKLFAASTYVPSSFSTINLPTNVTWDTSNLGVDGTIRIVSVARPQITGITPAGGGNYQLAFSGPGGSNYRVWGSTNLASVPITNTWSLLTNGVFGVSGTATFTDTTATNYPMRFYLISIP